MLETKRREKKKTRKRKKKKRRKRERTYRRRCCRTTDMDQDRCKLINWIRTSENQPSLRSSTPEA